MRTVNVNVYQFGELSDKAKEKARQWYRGCIDNSDFEGAKEQIKSAAVLCGFQPGMDLWWRLGYSQSDHACIDGRWRAEDVKAQQVRDEWTKDQRLGQIAEQFAEIAKRFPKARAVTQERYVVSDADFDPDEELSSDDKTEALKREAEQDLRVAIQSFNQWAYDVLRTEDEYLNSDECVDENITANEYEFTEGGERWTD